MSELFSTFIWCEKIIIGENNIYDYHNINYVNKFKMYSLCINEIFSILRINDILMWLIELIS